MRKRVNCIDAYLLKTNENINNYKRRGVQLRYSFRTRKQRTFGIRVYRIVLEIHNDGYFRFMAVLLIEIYNYCIKKVRANFFFIDFTHVLKNVKFVLKKSRNSFFIYWSFFSNSIECVCVHAFRRIDTKFASLGRSWGHRRELFDCRFSWPSTFG